MCEVGVLLLHRIWILELKLFAEVRTKIIRDAVDYVN